MRHFPAALSLLALAAVLPLAACKRPKVVEIDHRFSYNVAVVPSWYPEENEELTPAQKEVLSRRGKPDFIRFVWRKDGQIITSSDFSGKGDQLPEMLADSKKTWIYQDAKTEVEFLPSAGYEEHPLTEKLDLICKYGDPSSKTPVKKDHLGREIESWTWIDHGLKVDLADGLPIRETRFTPTGSGTFLIK